MARNVEAFLVLAAAILLAVLVPHRLLGPAALAALALAIPALFGIRSWLRRLGEAVGAVERRRAGWSPEMLAVLFGQAKRRVLRLLSGPGGEDAGAVLGSLRAAKARVLSAGMAVGILAVIAGIAAIVVYAD